MLGVLDEILRIDMKRPALRIDLLARRTREPLSLNGRLVKEAVRRGEVVLVAGGLAAVLDGELVDDVVVLRLTSAIARRLGI